MRVIVFFGMLTLLWFTYLDCKGSAKPNLNPEEIKILTNLSEYGLYEGENLADLIPKKGGFRYDLNTALFSDYTEKDRVIFLPKDTNMKYDSDREFDLPVGSIIAKTFSLSPVLERKDAKTGKRLETRLLIHQPKGWFAVSYVWDGEDKDARIAYAGENISLEYKSDSKIRNFTYSVPSRNQCTTCHQSYEGRKQSLVPIGIKAKHLNKIYSYDQSGENQLKLMEKKELLVGLSIWGVPKLVDAFDENESVEKRARSYLDINCSHCHNRNAAGGINSKLILSFEENDPSSIGVCKTPGSAGKGGGGLRYDIVPGNAEHSILYFRTATTEPGAMMPQIGRALAHKEGIEIVRGWINRMDKSDCP